MIYINSTISFIGLVLSLIGILFGIMVMVRCRGILKLSTIFLIIPIGLFGLYNLTKVLNLNDIFKTENFIGWLYIGPTLFILFALISMRLMINHIDSPPKRK